MKFSLAHKALALAATLTLASCGGGGKATFPINVTVSNVQFDGLVLTTNGMDLTVPKAADPTKPVVLTFPSEIEYGQTYNVIPKNSDLTNAVYGVQPKHQTCVPSSTYPHNFPVNGTAGQLAKIDIYYECGINSFALSGVVKGLTTTGLVIANGSNSSVGVSPAVDTNSAPTGADVAFSLATVPYNTTFGVSILTQPTGQTCSLTSGTTVGTMDDAAEAAGGVTNLVITCQ